MENSDDKQRIRRNMQDQQKESKREHQVIQPTDHTRNDGDIKGPAESSKTAEARPRQTVNKSSGLEQEEEQRMGRLEAACREETGRTGIYDS